jgi:hypothetical protein
MIAVFMFYYLTFPMLTLPPNYKTLTAVVPTGALTSSLARNTHFIVFAVEEERWPTTTALSRTIGVFLLILTLPFFLVDLLQTLSPCPLIVSPPKMSRRLKNIQMLWKRTGLITGLPTALLDSPMMLHPSHALFYDDVMMPSIATLPGGC